MRLLVKILPESEGLFVGLFDGLFAGLFVGLFAGLQAMWKRNCVAKVSKFCFYVMNAITNL